MFGLFRDNELIELSLSSIFDTLEVEYRNKALAVLESKLPEVEALLKSVADCSVEVVGNHLPQDVKRSYVRNAVECYRDTGDISGFLRMYCFEPKLDGIKDASPEEVRQGVLRCAKELALAQPGDAITEYGNDLAGYRITLSDEGQEALAEKFKLKKKEHIDGTKDASPEEVRQGVLRCATQLALKSIRRIINKEN